MSKERSAAATRIAEILRELEDSEQDHRVKAVLVHRSKDRGIQDVTIQDDWEVVVLRNYWRRPAEAPIPQQEELLGVTTSGEKIVFSWILWPDKATADAAQDAIHEDERFKAMADVPFDGRRMIFGSFEPIVNLRRDA